MHRSMEEAEERKPRVLVVGLDGASLELLDPWIDSGDMPNLARLIASGVRGGLESVVPPQTPPAWTSAITGVYPGKHGIFNFFRPRFGPGPVRLYGTAERRVPALWDLLGARGMRSVILHLPATFPPPALEGCLVVGVPITDLKADCTYPRELKDDLLAHIPGYKLFPNAGYLRVDRDAYFRDAVETLRAHTEEALYLMQRERWDLFFTLWHMGDGLMHFFWRDMVGKTGDAAREFYIRDYYREADRSLGRLLERAGDGTHVIVMSDHGFGGVDRAISLNLWLSKNGFLKARVPFPLVALKARRKLEKVVRRKLHLPSRKEESEDVMRRVVETVERFGAGIRWDRSRAHAELPGFIWINTRGRDAFGIVEPGEEYERERERIRAGLRALCDPETNEPVFSRVLTREEAFRGPADGDAPDLVALPRSGYVTTYGVQRERVIGPVQPRSWNGYHVMRGMIVLSGPGICSGERLEGGRIVDVAPTILHLLGLPVQPAMDGRVLEAAFQPSALEARPVRVGEIFVALSAGPAEDSDSEAIEQTLRDLGYM
jgi:predicted AlkP superfamily phosphohydrolase/phosphomutase